jgi:hypothetical protein
MDPITALGVASSAFSLLKKGFEAGRDIESMGSDLGRWMGAVGDIYRAEDAARKPSIFKKLVFKQSVEEEAMNAFMARKKAQQMREELREVIVWSRGEDAWQELLKMEADIRKKRLDDIKDQKRRQRKVLETIAVLVISAISVVGIFVFIDFLIGYQK